jgi:hypothetical protein
MAAVRRWTGLICALDGDHILPDELCGAFIRFGFPGPGGEFFGWNTRERVSFCHSRGCAAVDHMADRDILQAAFPFGRVK